MSRMQPLVAVIRQGAKVWNEYRELNPGEPELSGTQLSGLDLSGMNFRGAILRGADLSGTTLDGTLFAGANLHGVNFIGATFTHRTEIKPGELATTAFRGAKMTPQLLQATLEAIRASCMPRPVQSKKPAGVCE